MKKKFFTNISLLVIINLLVKPFWVLGIDLTVQNRVGAGEYGFYFSLLSFSLLINIIQDLGITNFNNRNIARNHGKLSSQLPNIISLKLILTSLYFFLSLLIAYAIGYEWFQLKLLIILLFNQFLNSFNLYFRSNITALQLFKTDSILSITDRSLMILICGLLLWGNVTKSPFRIEWFVWSQTASYFITATISCFIVVRKSIPIQFKPDINELKIILRKSFPYALLGLFMVLYYRSDSVMLERLLVDGRVQAGIYAQGFRIMDAASMIGFLFAGILLPMFSKMIRNNESVTSLFRFSTMLLTLPAITGAIALFVYRFELMDFLYTSHSVSSGIVFGTLIISFIFICLSIMSGTLLTANGNLKQLNIIASTGLILNILLNFILIPVHLAQGSAIASLLTQSLMAALQFLLIVKYFTRKINMGLMLRIIIFIGIIAIWSGLIKNAGATWIYGIPLILSTGLILAFALKLFTVSEFKGLLQASNDPVKKDKLLSP